jgi:hypothetical protein
MLALLAQLGILLERNGTTPEYRAGISAILGRHLQAIVESQAQLRLRTTLSQLPEAPSLLEEKPPSCPPPTRDVAGWLNLLEQQHPTALESEVMPSTDLTPWGQGIEQSMGGIGWPEDANGGIDFGGTLGFWTGQTFTPI